jgi:hypothetical protein
VAAVDVIYPEKIEPTNLPSSDKAVNCALPTAQPSLLSQMQENLQFETRQRLSSQDGINSLKMLSSSGCFGADRKHISLFMICASEMPGR